MSHTQRCVESNRFGDGFDCICDEDPLRQAQARVDDLSARLGQLKQSHDHLLTFTVGVLQVENAAQQVTIGKLERELARAREVGADFIRTIRVEAGIAYSPVPPDRIRELAIAFAHARRRFNEAESSDRMTEGAALQEAHAALGNEVERVLKEKSDESPGQPPA